MKKIILSLMFVGGLLAGSENLSAFTAVSSGAWSNAATWGGVGPGSTVTNQDIIIPSGITVDMDVDVVFSGIPNSFWTAGTLMSTANHQLSIDDGTLTGSRTITIGKLVMRNTTSAFAF